MAESVVLDHPCKDQLRKWLVRHAKFTTLYKMTRDGVDSGKFHQLCNGKGATVTVAKLNNGTIIGGYTGLSWASTGPYRADPTAFIFRLYNATNFQPVRYTPKTTDGANAIYDNANYGPTFGNAHDLFFFTNNLAPHSQLGGAYNLPPGAGQFDLVGVYNGWVVSEIEVLDVSKDDPLLTLLTPWRQVVWTSAVLEEFKTQVRSYTPAHAQELGVGFANVLVIGGTGAGKTTFLSTAVSALTGRMKALSAKGKGTDSITVNLLKHKFEAAPTIRFWDTKGWSASAYRYGEMNYILDGHLPHDFSLQNIITPFLPGFITAPKFSQRAHVVLIIVGADVASDAAYLARVREFRDLSRARGISVVIGLTKVDIVDATILQNVAIDGSALTNLYASVAVKELITKVSADTGIDVQYISPVKGYCHEETTNMYVDILTLLMLKKLLASADDNFNAKHNTSIMAQEDSISTQ